MNLARIENTILIGEGSIQEKFAPLAFTAAERATLIPKADLEAATAWREGKVIFHEELLGESGAPTESRLASSGDNELDWLFGVFYQREDFLFSNYSAEPALPMPNKLVSVSSNQNITEQFAAFTEETLHLTDALSLTAGLRYFRTEVKTTRSVKASLFQGPVDFTEYLGPAKENGFTPKLAVSA